jgi:hypothetical protein
MLLTQTLTKHKLSSKLRDPKNTDKKTQAAYQATRHIRDNMGLSKTIQKWKDSLSTPKSTTQQPPKVVKNTQSDEDLVSMQLPRPQYAPRPSHADAALYRPTSQIVCHSPLDKRNKPKKQKKNGGVVEVQGVGYGDGKKYTTSQVLFSSTTHAAVEIKSPTSPMALPKPGESSGYSQFSADSIRL